VTSSNLSRRTRYPQYYRPLSKHAAEQIGQQPSDLSTPHSARFIQHFKVNKKARINCAISAVVNIHIGWKCDVTSWVMMPVTTFMQISEVGSQNMASRILVMLDRHTLGVCDIVF
jgi:hypothetical protein